MSRSKKGSKKVAKVKKPKRAYKKRAPKDYDKRADLVAQEYREEKNVDKSGDCVNQGQHDWQECLRPGTDTVIDRQCRICKKIIRGD